MTVFKCKRCGATIEFNQGDTVAICEYCGTKQTLPRLDNDRKANLYDRANHFRRNNEFDKAMCIYEQILNEDNTDAEAYWSIVLCRYGIEYVEDPASHKRVPTVNRAQFTSIFDDDNYKSALKYADFGQRELYESEAETINNIQKGILAISSKEEPFDVFICYKETDNNGRRTQDSVLANDLYHQLIQEGFKVFFSRITLEDKLGTAYEPYIFAALNSAKVMVVLGTKQEYFNAVWVKNEWSRYLALVKQSGGKKILIPAYRDMDPYDLPEEFSHLQAQDMGKLGFMQDLIRGIKKLVESDKNQKTVKETVIVGNASGNIGNTAPLLKRAFIFLEDGNWSDAENYCERVLDLDPENAEAYLGKLMAEKHIRRRENLRDCTEPFDDSNNYAKAMRFGSADLKSELSNAIDYINERNENERNEAIYSEAVRLMGNVKWDYEYNNLSKKFKSITGYKDADVLAEQCLEKAEICRKESIYNDANNEMEADVISGYEAAIKKFEKIRGWRDTDGKIEKCRQRIAEINDKERMEATRRAEIERKRKKKRKVALIVCGVVAVVISGWLIMTRLIIPSRELAKIDSANVGDYVKFGKYNHSAIEWQVLKKNDGKALLISRYALDKRAYDEFTYVTGWEKCTLREWLNSDFYDSAFISYEKEKILETHVSEESNTNDKIFLLGINEAVNYLDLGGQRQCTTNDGKNVWWWLRSLGSNSKLAAIVNNDGSVDYNGISMDNEGGGVRPALWVNLES